MIGRYQSAGLSSFYENDSADNNNPSVCVSMLKHKEQRLSVRSGTLRHLVTEESETIR